MDRYLRPERLCTDPSSPTAKQEYLHWKRTFDAFLVSVNAHTPDKLQTLINHVSPAVYAYIADAADYDAAVGILKGLYVQSKNASFVRFQLGSRRQESGESLDIFVQQLKALAAEIEFKQVTAEQYKSDLLTDALISGVNSNFIRQRLLEANKKTFAEVYELARSLDLAQKNSEAYLPSTPNFLPAASVHQGLAEEPVPPSSAASVQHQSGGFAGSSVSAAVSYPRSCFNCGNSSHPKSQCPARNAKCHKCSRKGHFSKVCRSSGKAESVSAALAPFLPPLTGVYPVVRSELEDVSAISSVFRRKVPFSEKFMVSLAINGTPIDTLVDTGAKVNCLDAATAEGLQVVIVPSNSAVGLAAGNSAATSRGVCRLDVFFQSKLHRDVRFTVLDDLVAPCILGEEFLLRFDSLEIKLQGDPQVTLAALPPMVVDAPRLFSHLTPDVHPVITKSRKFSQEDHQFIKGEVDKLLQNSIIEPCSSPWRAQVLITKNQNRKRRMVIDYSRTINRFTLLDGYPFPTKEKLVSNVSQYRVYSTYDLRDAYHLVVIPEEDREYTGFEACGKLFQFKRMCFGLRNAIACFQRIMDQIIQVNQLKGVFAYVDNLYICGMDQREHNANLQAFLKAAETHNLTFNTSKTVLSTRSLNLLGYTISEGKVMPDRDRVKPLLELPIPTSSPALKRYLGMFAYYAAWIPQFSDKIHPLTKVSVFPLSAAECAAFESIKLSLVDATLGAIDEGIPFTVETDASSVAISASLNQEGRPVAFMSKTLHGSDLRHTSVEKEAFAIVEALRHWKHLLVNRPFTLITDQKPVSFMFSENSSRIKNDKIQRWRVELSPLSYSIQYRPGKDNVVADALTRVSCGAVASADDGESITATSVPCSAVSSASLMEIHSSLCHPGVTRLTHFIRAKNLPYSVEDIRRTISNCKICCELKPNFFKKEPQSLIKATQPFQCLDIDFKGPLLSNSRNKYMLTVVDEWSRFPFAFPTADITAGTVIKCLTQLFVLFGFPSYIHSDRGAQFLSQELKSHLHSRGVVTSRTTSYNPRGNGLTEKYNDIVWKAVLLALRTRDLPVSCWESVLPEALHSIRSLLCTSTNATPHERFFGFPRKSASGASMPDWLTTPGPVLLRRLVRQRKSDPLVDEVELIESNPKYAHIRHPDGRESTVSLRHLAPTSRAEPCVYPSVVDSAGHLQVDEVFEVPQVEIAKDAATEKSSIAQQTPGRASGEGQSIKLPTPVRLLEIPGNTANGGGSDSGQPPILRRSTRSSAGIPPDRLEVS